MSKAAGLFMFVLGAAVGSTVTYIIANEKIRAKYEQIAQEEIDSVKEVFSKRESNMEIKVETPSIEARVDKFSEKPEISQYAEMLKKEGYVSETAELGGSKPYVISPEEFGEFDEYDTISLTYFADQVLADDNGEKIDDVDAVVGMESLTHFGEYEDDSVFVRNDRLKTDYEILMDQRTYSEVLSERPHKKEE